MIEKKNSIICLILYNKCKKNRLNNLNIIHVPKIYYFKSFKLFLINMIFIINFQSYIFNEVFLYSIQ